MAIMLGLAALAPAPAFAQSDNAQAIDGLPQDLQSWSEAEFPTDRPAATLTALFPLLQSPDPFLRDEIGFTGLSAILRRGDASPETLRLLRAELEAELSRRDPAGVAHPFAILALAEIARTDRIEAYMSDAEFAQLVDTAAGYLRSVEDYRGYEPGDGWRHGVAHGADFALQLVLNPRIDKAQLAALAGAIADQVAPGHAYVFGESRRLARPVLYMAVGGYVPADGWNDWLASLSARPIADNANTDDARLAELTRAHNLRAFLLELYLTASSNDVAELEPLGTAARDALRTLDS
jgi:hypothetical protein